MKAKMVMWFARMLGVPIDVHPSHFPKNVANPAFRYGVPHTDGKPIL